MYFFKTSDFSAPIFKGFLLTSILLLGAALEQGLLPDISSERSTFFLIGNLTGLPLASFLWSRKGTTAQFALRSWTIESILLVFSAWYSNPFLSFFLGLFFSVLLIHLAILAKNIAIEGLIPSVGLGILSGNVILLILERLPYPIGLMLLALGLVSWRIKRPDATFSIKNLSFRPSRHLLFFLFFFFTFYLLGGFYYSCLETSQGPVMDFTYFNLISTGGYVAGILALIKNPWAFDFLPAMIIPLMGLSVIFQMAHLPDISLFFIEVGFGMADVFSISYILAMTENLLETALSLTLFPLSILSGTLLFSRLGPDSSQSLEWQLFFLFLMIVPAILCCRFLMERHGNDQKQTPLALPPPPSTRDDITNNNVSGSSNGIEDSHPSDKFILESIAKKLRLSERETEVFLLLIEGKKLREISSDLGIALGTVKAICSRIYEKAGARNKKELFRKLQNG